MSTSPPPIPLTPPPLSAPTAYEKLPADFVQSVAILLELYKENTAHGRHIETQRQLVSGFIIAIGAAIVGALATLKFDEGACKGLGSVLIGFGLMGTMFSVVQYGKWTVSREKWRAMRAGLDRLCPSARLENTLGRVEKTMKRKHCGWFLVSTLPLHWLWTLLNVSVFVLGILLVFEPRGVRTLQAEYRQKSVAVQPIRNEPGNPLLVKIHP